MTLALEVGCTGEISSFFHQEKSSLSVAKGDFSMANGVDISTWAGYSGVFQQ
jgi:hypothetical protein